MDFVEEGHTHRSAAARFRVSIKFVNDMVLLKRRTGALEAKPQGNGGGHGKLAGVAGWIEGRIREKRDLTLDELVVELRETQSVEAHRVSIWRHLRGLGLTHKKKTCAPSSRSGLKLRWRVMSGSAVVNPSCATC
ncbi:transposase [Hoeflea sp.]|uniref:transposase n=1 Tax=Hoeflea sp. TaxID=1940281 RepID=UPI0025BD4D3F|nr:transposase [Hoeflea sp.]